MHEDLILDAIEKITANTLTDKEKSILTAAVWHEYKHKRFAGSLTGIVMEKINELTAGNYREAQALPKTFQDFSETGEEQKPFEVKMDGIDEFLEKMMSKTTKDEDFFGDTWEFYHPTENMKAEGLPRHRSDFVVKT